MKRLLTVFTGLLLFFVVNCSDNTTVGGHLPPPTLTPAPVPATAYLYGNYFGVDDSSAYRTLLEACRRCGLKRFHQTPGGVVYEKTWDWFDSSPRNCEIWDREVYMQIEFQDNRLPTTAKVSFFPKASSRNLFGPNTDVWDKRSIFTVTATARPINENEGFQVLLTPAGGLKGVQTVDIRSEYTNHVRDSSLSINVYYGRERTIFSGSLVKLTEKATGEATADCSTYTN